MSVQVEDGERRDCLDCHGTLEFDGDDELWYHISDTDCSRRW